MTSHSPAQHCNCVIDRLLRRDEKFIFITDAQKQSDTTGAKTYVTYSIRVGDEIETKHRYSEFESLRKSLVKLHPSVIVPPIPEKHSLVDYAALQTRVKDDASMVEKRKRMLQTFLNRVAKHPVLGQDHIFHRFLESGVPWSDVLHSPPLSVLPRSPLQTVASKHIDLPPNANPNVLGSNFIPIPTAAYVLKNPDPKFEESEKFTYRISNYMSNNLEKTQRKVIRRLGDLAEDYAELGAVYNGFSLNEVDDIATAIEKIGQAMDSSYIMTGQMVTALEGEFAEPIQEHAQFAMTIKQVLKFRHLKHAQLEMVESLLAKKKDSLDELLAIENEARRLEEAMARERTIGSNAVDVDELNATSQSGQDNELSNDEQANPFTSYSAHTSPAAYRRRQYGFSGPMRMINAVGHTLQGIIDVDPETTRRNQIGKTKDAMDILQEALEIIRLDLDGISVDVQEDLNRFQSEKMEDLRNMLIAYAKIHIRYCEQNLAAWKEARDEVDKIPDPFA